MLVLHKGLRYGNVGNVVPYGLKNLNHRNKSSTFSEVGAFFMQKFKIDKISFYHGPYVPLASETLSISSKVYS